MHRWIFVIGVLLLVAPIAPAGTWTLFDWSANINGTTYNPPALPATVDSSGFDFSTGLGSLIFAVNEPGPDYVGVYFSLYYDNGFGDTTGAYASQAGAIPAGVTYQLGWPGAGSPTVFDNFAANALDGSNTVGAYVPPPNACCDVAMAMLHAFTLAAGQTSTITYNVGDTQPVRGFYLQETDNDSGNSVYLTETFQESTPNNNVPEPASGLLLASCLGLLCAARRRRADRAS